MKNTFKVTALAALLSMVPMAQTFAADSGQEAQATKAKLDSARAESAKIRNQIGLTLEELNRLQVASVELRPQFDKYAGQLVKMEEQAKATRDRVIGMEGKGKVYFQAWEDQINSISNADIRKEAQQRYNKRAKSYNKIIKAMVEARDELVPFMSNLNDIKKMLDSELSRESVKSAKTTIKSANSHGKVVSAALTDVEAELDRVSAELAKYK